MLNTTAKPGKGKGCLWAVIIVQGILLFMMFVFSIGMLSLGKFVKTVGPSLDSLGEDEYPTMTETWSCGAGDTKVIVIPLRGMITLERQGGFFQGDGATAGMALASIRRATHDPDVKAIILDVDSGGGSITASDVIYNALLDFKKAQEGRKVVALFGDIAASGAYYISLPADSIVAHPTTITGSIGVLIQTLNLKGLGEKIGVKDVTIKSGKNKDMLNPFEDLSSEQRSMLQEVIDEMHDRFVSLVATSRHMEKSAVMELADGRIFAASKAKNLGLVDKIGYWQDAMDTTAQLLGVEEIKVFRYEREFSLSSLFKAAIRTPAAADLRLDSSDIKILYLWQIATGTTK